MVFATGLCLCLFSSSFGAAKYPWTSDRAYPISKTGDGKHEATTHI